MEPIVTLLAEDAWWTMPPEPYGYQGREAIKEFIAHAFATRENPRRLIPTRANTQPAFVQYAKDPHTDVGRASRAARADTRRRPHLAHHPLRRDQRPTALRTPPNDPVVADRLRFWSTLEQTSSMNFALRLHLVRGSEARVGGIEHVVDKATGLAVTAARPVAGAVVRGLGTLGRMSIRHGYTNATRVDGERIVKRYLGMDAAERMRTEVDTIQRTAGRVPAPEIVHVDEADCAVTFRRLPGRHGQGADRRGRRRPSLGGGGPHAPIAPRRLAAADAGRTETTARRICCMTRRGWK